jgi:hypothetical protein
LAWHSIAIAEQKLGFNWWLHLVAWWGAGGKGQPRGPGLSTLAALS